MKKRLIVIIGLLSLFVIIVMKSEAVIKLTPDGGSSPDNSASFHLKGSFSTGNFFPGPGGAVISGENTYTSLYLTYGGYFSANGISGRGVYAKASGANGMAVYGFASNNGDVENHGGYFEASGNSGKGVFGKASGGVATGVWGKATGTSGRGVVGQGTGIYSYGVYGSGVLWDFYAAGGKIGYGPFTGAHEVKFENDSIEQIVQGMIVSVTGKTEARTIEDGVLSLSSTLPTVAISTKSRDKAVFGVIVSESHLPDDHWYKAKEDELFGVVNALGEGRVWVTDMNGEIEAGDYITTSDVPGYGQLQDDDFLHSYTLGKAIETIDWGQVTETVRHDGKTYKRYLLAVVYTSG